MNRKTRRRSSRVINQSARSPPKYSRLPPSVTPIESTYGAYTREIMNNNEYFNCCCGDPPDYSRLILCDMCGDTWSHLGCVGFDDMDRYSISQSTYICFHCRGIFCDEDRLNKDKDDADTSTIEDAPPTNTTSSITSTTSIANGGSTAAPNLEKLPIGKSTELFNKVYDKRNVNNVYVYDDDEHEAKLNGDDAMRRIYLEYPKKNNFIIKFRFKYFKDYMLNINAFKKKNAKKSEIFIGGSSNAALVKLIE